MFIGPTKFQRLYLLVHQKPHRWRRSFEPTAARRTIKTLDDHPGRERHERRRTPYASFVGLGGVKGLDDGLLEDPDRRHDRSKLVVVGEVRVYRAVEGKCSG